MKVKKAKWLVVLMVVAMLVTLFPVMGFADDNGCLEPPAGADWVTLYAGQTIEVGKVYVWNDADTLFVQYWIDDDAWDDGDGWGLYETHVHVGESLDDFPLNRGGNPQIGHFAYKATHDGVQCYTEEIPLSELEEFGDDLIIAAHAVVERIVEEGYCETVSGDITPELSWMRSSEDDVAHFPGKGAQWDPEIDGFTIPLDSEEVVWDGGTADQNVMEDTTPSGRWPGYNDEISYATYIYAYNDGDSHDDQADLRRFQASFDVDIPEGSEITGGKLGSVNEGYEDMIPINDNVYIFVNEDLLFWGGTIPDATTISFEGMFGKQAVRGGTSPDWDPVETDGWHIPGTIPDIDAADFLEEEENTLDVFAEEYSIFGAMHELYLTLEYEYEECYPDVWEDETAWGDGDRFNEQGNWATYFGYTIEDVCEEQQLLLNPGAEDGMNNWDFTANVVRSNDEREQSTGMVYPLSGGYFFDFTGANVAEEGIGYAASMEQEVDVSGYDGCPFTAGGWIQTELWPDPEKTDIEDNDYGKLIVTFYNSNNDVLGSSDTGIIGYPVEGYPTTDGKQYAEFYLTGTVPADAAYAVYELEGYLIQGSFINVFYDDLYFWVGK